MSKNLRQAEFNSLRKIRIRLLKGQIGQTNHLQEINVISGENDGKHAEPSWWLMFSLSVLDSVCALFLPAVGRFFTICHF